MIVPKFPNPAEIALSIERCETILADKSINHRKNFALKEGYAYCVQLMKNRLVNPENPFFIADQESELDATEIIFLKQMEPITKLTTQRGRAIAILCNDWLNGQEEKQSFLLERIEENEEAISKI